MVQFPTDRWREYADKLSQPLKSRECFPVRAVKPVADPAAWQGWHMAHGDPDWQTVPRIQGDSLILDFGTHGVGTINLELDSSSYDSPLRLRLLAGEFPAEVTDEVPFQGNLSRSWIQEEIINIDRLQEPVVLPRRYAFRYLRIDCPAFSGSYRIRNVTAVFSSAMDDQLLPRCPAWLDPELAAIDRAGILTLQNCMQQVFEDGPKRDRRLWLGDLKLQALVNAVSFRNFELVERCLYLLASAVDAAGMVPGCVFDRPAAYRGCDIIDYSLLLGPTLLDHYRFSDRRECVENLYGPALHQLTSVKTLFGRNGLMATEMPLRPFIDHQNHLDRQAAFTGVYIYSLNAHAELADILGDDNTSARLRAESEQCCRNARKHHYDSSSGLVHSGACRQYSYASQIWMILSGVLTQEEGCRALQAIARIPDAVWPVSPYLWHYYLEAAFKCGIDDIAWQFIKDYWGGMVKCGADTFWEVYVPEDPFFSPYHDYRLNSACHAWSCTPSWFIRSRKL